MAVTIRDNTANGSMYKEWATLLDGVIFDADAQQNEYKDLLNGLAVVKDSKRWAEKSVTIGGLGDFDGKAEAIAAQEDTFVEGYGKMIQHESFSKTFKISKEMLDDNQIEEAKAKAYGMVTAYDRSRAKYLSQALTSSVGAATTMTFGGTTGIDITGADNLALFHSAHTLKNASGTQCNIFTNGIGTDASGLNALAVQMRNFKDDRGEVLGYMPDTIIIPGNRPALEDQVKKIIGSDGETGSNKNDINTQRGKYKLIVDFLWTPATGDPFILQSSKALKELIGTRFYNRTALDVANDEDIEKRVLIYNGFARWSCGFTNWRHVIMGGAQASDGAQTISLA